MSPNSTSATSTSRSEIELETFVIFDGRGFVPIGFILLPGFTEAFEEEGEAGMTLGRAGEGDFWR